MHRRTPAQTYRSIAAKWFPFLCDTCSIVHCKTFPKGMAVWFGWMPGSCFHDISSCSRLDHAFGCHFSGEVFNSNQISHQRLLLQQEKGTFDNFGLLDLLTRLQRGTTGRMVEIRPRGNKCNMLSSMGIISSKRSGVLWCCNFYCLLFAPGRDHLLLLQDPSSFQTDCCQHFPFG